MRSLRLALLFALAAATLPGCTRVVPPEPPPSPRDLPPPSTERADPTPRPAPEPAVAPVDPPPAPVGPTRPAASATPLPPLRLPETGELRGLWVVRTALLDPDSARLAVRRAHAAGFNTVFVQVRGRGDAYYRSSREPRPDPLGDRFAGYDPLDVVLEEARARGVAVHAWVNTHVVASARLPPRDPDHLVWRRPELLAVPRELAGRLYFLDPRDPAYLRSLLDWTLRNEGTVEGLYTNPAHPDVHDHLHAVVTELVDRYDLDGLHLDYVRYPSPDFDYSRPSLEAFREWVREREGDVGALAAAEAAWIDDPFDYPRRFPGHWDDFRREGVSTLVERLFRAARARRPDLVISAAVFAGADDARNARFQAWEDWLTWGTIDAVAPMAYTPSDAVFLSQIERAVRVAGGHRVWAGLGIYRDSFQGAVAKGRLARRAGVGGVALFSYDWAVGPDGAREGRGAYLDRFSRELWDIP